MKSRRSIPRSRGDLLPIYFSLRPLGTWKLQREFYSVILTMYHLEACSDEEYLSEEELRVSVQRNIIITFKNSNLLLSTFQPLCHLNVHILRGAWREPMKTLKNKNKNKKYIYITIHTLFLFLFPNFSLSCNHMMFHLQINWIRYRHRYQVLI